MKTVEKTIVTRIYIQENGDLIVTDLWEELSKLVSVTSEGEENVTQDL